MRDNLERAAKFSCYVLVNRLVFYKTLRKKFTRLKALKIPKEVENSLELQKSMKNFFESAMQMTKDYETVFRGDFGDNLPFLSNSAVPAWKDLIASLDQFDFTKFNYDVIGPIFERLISPEERHRYGQHYTKPEIVDLIEAFCIRKHDSAVLDPSCGGGTFLVRAYNRKRFLADQAGIETNHEAMLGQLLGIDISNYATHLTMMNLATRDLIDERNYPLVAQDDFFDARCGEALFQIPMAVGGGGKQMQPIPLEPVDAVVGNPPYVRQEEISTPPTTSAKRRVRLRRQSLRKMKNEAREYKNRLRKLAKSEWPEIELSGRSDLHVYFWPHATTFLKQEAIMAF